MLNSAAHEVLNAHTGHVSIKIPRNSAFAGSIEPRMLFFLLINVKIPAFCWQFNSYKQEKAHAQLS